VYVLAFNNVLRFGMVEGIESIHLAASHIWLNAKALAKLPILCGEYFAAFIAKDGFDKFEALLVEPRGGYRARVVVDDGKPQILREWLPEQDP
jgi:hypothetical protein